MDALKLNLKIQYALGVLLTLFLVLMLLKDPSDSNTDIFAFILHFPFIIALCLYNGIALRLSKKLIEKWFYFYIPIIPGVVWLLASRFKLTIRFWEFNVEESITIIAIWFLANLLTPYLLKRKTISNTE